MSAKTQIFSGTLHKLLAEHCLGPAGAGLQHPPRPLVPLNMLLHGNNPLAFVFPNYLQALDVFYV